MFGSVEGRGGVQGRGRVGGGAQREGGARSGRRVGTVLVSEQ